MLGAPETGSGFPSAHTLVLGVVVGAGALVVCRATTSRPTQVAAVVCAGGLALAMGASRLYLGDHWLSDVLASYALTVVILAAVALLPGRRTQRR